MNFSLAGACICQVSFAIHVASVSSHAGSFLTQVGPYKLYEKTPDSITLIWSNVWLGVSKDPI